MFRDPQFVVTFQLALIGIVLIGGLFLVWKAMARLEEKVDMIFMQHQAKAAAPFKVQLDNSGLTMSPLSCDKTVPCNPMEEMMNDPLLQKLFAEQMMEEQENSAEEEEDPNFVIYGTTFNMSPNTVETDSPQVEVEEIQKEQPSMVPPSESEHGEVLSKNKLRHMTLDKVKALCDERGISSEGTKNQLIERILQV
jgi:hypothetical protein